MLSESNLTSDQLPKKTSTSKSEADIQSIVSQLREYKQVKVQDSDKEFTLMTYNVLSQDLLEKHAPIYSHCRGTNCLIWPNRGLLIQRELRDIKADIVCLQEVHCEHYKEMYLPFMRSLGYEGIYKKRTGDKKDGCAMFYASDKFTLEKAFEIEFHRVDVSKILTKDNVAIIGVFNPKIGTNKLIVATTHLNFDPKRGDIKLAQLRLLLAKIEKVARKEGKPPPTEGVSGAQVDYRPVILCGDMNTEPYSPIYRFIREGTLAYNGFRTGDLSGQAQGRHQGPRFKNQELKLQGSNSSSISHVFNFNAVYPIDDRDNDENSYVSTDHQKCSSLVDHIFYNNSDEIELIGYKQLLTTDQINRIGGLPNTYLGSDHLSLIARFLFKPLRE